MSRLFTGHGNVGQTKGKIAEAGSLFREIFAGLYQNMMQTVTFVERYRGLCINCFLSR